MLGVVAAMFITSCMICEGSFFAVDIFSSRSSTIKKPLFYYSTIVEDIGIRIILELLLTMERNSLYLISGYLFDPCTRKFSLNLHKLNSLLHALHAYNTG